jgi:hypothetical protein
LTDVIAFIRATTPLAGEAWFHRHLIHPPL